MTQSEVQKQAKPQRLRNFGLWTGFIIVFCLLHLGGVYLLPPLILLIAALVGCRHAP